MKQVEKQGKRVRVKTINEDPTMTQQQYKDQVNVNKIMEKYKKTGTITHVRNAANGVYLDLTEIPDYPTALMQVQQAQQMFEQIPAHIRMKFSNDPGQLITYLKNPDNLQEAIKYGLLVPSKIKQNEQTQTNEQQQTPQQPSP